MFKINKFIKTVYKINIQYFSTTFEQSNSNKLPINKIMENYKNLLDKSNILEEIIPRKFTNENELSSFFGINNYSTLVNIKDKITLDSINSSVNVPLWDLLDRGGKRWRPILGLMIAKYFNINIIINKFIY